MTNTTAVLICSEPPMPGAVPFLFNPDKITMSREVAYRSHGSSSQNGNKNGETGTSFQRAEALKISVSDVVFSGSETKELCDQLLNWMSPGSGALGQVAGAAALAKGGSLVKAGVVDAGAVNRLPVVRFIYGPPMQGFCYNVVLLSVSINYTRFSHAGVPIRARVTISMKEQPSLLGTLPTNPTSGGLPGRRSYTVTEGEDLVNLARTQYGSTSHWRRLADANAIDDPLRMRPGTTVYLPSPHELD
ncbi:LysM peptidoglycan-binding domain-containing protein [Streptomyces sp. NPDC086023]|uniref:LysM peptidoglycan-binding domain-containing protein n=1 Tax=Streptomyces sp. NPDC086023 TaxID=3365746 RepID=UPI0037D5EB70